MRSLSPLNNILIGLCAYSDFGLVLIDYFGIEFIINISHLDGPLIYRLP